VEYYVPGVQGRRSGPPEATFTPPSNPPEVIASLGRTPWLVITAVGIALLAALLVLGWRVDYRDGGALELVLSGALVAFAAYRLASIGYAIAIRGDKVRVRSLRRRWEFPLSHADGASPLCGIRPRRLPWMWSVYFVKEGQRRGIALVTRQDLGATALSKAVPARR
jgi:hypothetical protein